ncbi:MAG: M16 family metallopeptidase, partial [Chloroflexota bacterium]
AWETLGTPETIKALTIDQMREYWNTRYGARNIIFAIAGNIDWEQVKGAIEGLTKDWQLGETGRKEQPVDFRPSFNVYHREQFVQEQMGIGVPSVANRDPRYFAARVLATVLGDDTGSRLYWALYQEGLAETANAQVFDFDDSGMLYVHLTTEPALAQRALEATEFELKRIQGFDVEQDELDRAKAKLVSSVIIGGESTNERVMELISSWLTHARLETLEEIREKFEAVTLADLRDYLQAFPVWPSQVISAAGPLASDALQQPTL